MSKMWRDNLKPCRVWELSVHWACISDMFLYFSRSLSYIHRKITAVRRRRLSCFSSRWQRLTFDTRGDLQIKRTVRHTNVLRCCRLWTYYLTRVKTPHRFLLKDYFCIYIVSLRLVLPLLALAAPAGSLRVKYFNNCWMDCYSISHDSLYPPSFRSHVFTCF